MLVDENGFQELADLHDEMYERTLDIQAKSAERLTDAEDEAINTVSATMFFETPERRHAPGSSDGTAHSSV